MSGLLPRVKDGDVPGAAFQLSFLSCPWIEEFSKPNMAVQSLRRLVAAWVWLPAGVYSHIAGTERFNPTSPVETGLAPARVGHLELQHPPAPTPHARALFQRQSGENTCGFVGDERVPFTCSAEWGAECRVNSDARAIGCCLSTACNIWTACLPYTSSRLASNRDTDRTMYCSDLDEPECATLVYADGDYSGWTIPLCAATSVVLPIFDITSGSNGGVTSSGGGGRNGVAGPSGVANPTDGGGVANPTDSVNLDTANSSGKTPEEAVASTVNTALIVGAVVGGISFLAMVGIIIFLIIYCGRRKKRNQELRLQQAGQPTTIASAGAGDGGTAPPNFAPPPEQQMSTIPDGAPPMGFAQGAYAHHGDNKPAMQESFTPVTSVAHVTPTGTPAPGYTAVAGQHQQQQQQQQQWGSPPAPVSPQFTGQMGNQQPAMPVSPQVTGYGMYAGQQPQPQQAQQQAGGYFPSNAVELSTQRGDGQVHEVQ